MSELKWFMIPSFLKCLYGLVIFYNILLLSDSPEEQLSVHGSDVHKIVSISPSYIYIHWFFFFFLEGEERILWLSPALRIFNYWCFRLPHKSINMWMHGVKFFISMDIIFWLLSCWVRLYCSTFVSQNQLLTFFRIGSMKTLFFIMFTRMEEVFFLVICVSPHCIYVFC